MIQIFMVRCLFAKVLHFPELTYFGGMTSYLQQRTLYPPLVGVAPSPVLGLVVTVPAYDESDLLLSLKSLEACALPDCDVEVLVLINHAEGAEARVQERSRRQYEDLSAWAVHAGRAGLRFHILYRPDLPRRHAGVGLARKILMDEACFRFAKAGREDGIIACFDADARVQSNYFQALCSHFERYPEQDACSIRFEHPTEGADWPPEVYAAIAQYELHLRVFLAWQRWAGFPFAYQTVGSSMAVRASAYQREGGMNRRQAGEDFYFLQKFIELGKVGELQETCVIPSPRPSTRVPFGTGRAIGKMLSEGTVWPTYAPDSFRVLRPFYQSVPDMYAREAGEILELQHPLLRSFLGASDFVVAFRQIQSNTATPAAFAKRFFRWFSAFRQMKFLHYAREQAFPDVPVVESAREYFRETQGAEKELPVVEWLRWFRGEFSV